MSGKIEKDSVYDITIRLFIISLIIAWCFLIFYPSAMVCLGARAVDREPCVWRYPLRQHFVADRFGAVARFCECGHQTDPHRPHVAIDRDHPWPVPPGDQCTDVAAGGRSGAWFPDFGVLDSVLRQHIHLCPEPGAGRSAAWQRDIVVSDSADPGNHRMALTARSGPGPVPGQGVQSAAADGSQARISGIHQAEKEKCPCR